ncbi:MAG: carbohydrate binding domain-containing protein [Armatimonadota bacterium]|jgi:hypothetical protein
MLCPVRFAIIACAALVAVAAPAQDQLLTNPGFEEFGDDGVPAGWSRYGGRVPESVIEPADEARSGERALRMLDTGPEVRDNTYATGVIQEVPVEPGETYLLSVWARAIARNHDQAVNLQLRFLPGNQLQNMAVNPEIGGDWQRYSIGMTAPEGATRAAVYIYTMHYWTSETLIDDASLQVVSPETWGPRFPLAAHGSTGIEEARELNLRTPIVEGGAAIATICVPDRDDAAALGERLAAAIEERTGARPQVTGDARSLVGADGTIIALGNLNDNVVIERLYWNKYVKIDAQSPGEGAHVLQVVHEPYNWPLGTNIVVVGASDAAGLAAGVEALIERIPEAQTWAIDGPLVEVSNARELSAEAAREIIDRPVDIDVTRRFWEAAQMYRDTGQIAWAERAKRILLGPAAERFIADPHFHITWPEETTSNMIGAMWDVIEEAPVWTDEERALATNVILNTLYVLPRLVSGYGGIEQNPGIIWNHTTFPLLGIYWMARWFDRFHGNVDGQMSVMLGKCRHAFMNQARSWKPQEDAGGYVSIVPRHTIDYTLAENDYTYFDNGQVLRHAEYEVGFCDNTGDAAGFGDTGYARAPYAQNLHWTLWYYRDGRFKWWLERIGQTGSIAPYDPAIEPVRWDDLAGSTVFELHPEVYEYTSNYADYGGEVTPPNIPLEKCFDKIAFRESLEMDAEYFLLDGYSRGKHLQYDGNCIIKYFADGHDWLIDGDYLVRNTTDHNGVSVIRDGRVAELIPACTALEAFADLPTATLTETVVYDFNGCDWIRNITWLKGEFVLVTDRLRANEAGDYTFVGNWKTLAEGEQRIEDGRIFVTERTGLGGAGNRELVTVTQPEEGVERAVRFVSRTSRLDTVMELPAGEYEMALFARGEDGGSDSFFVSINGGAPIDFHIPQGRFGPSSATWDHETPTPNITIEEDGLHRVTVSMRENPAPMLDRIVVRTPGGEVVAEVEAEDAPPLPDDWQERAPTDRFFIKADGAAESKLTGRISHVGLHITYMRQRLIAELQPGESRTFHTIFYNDTDAAPKDYDVRRISDEAALITRAGEPHMVVLTGDEAMLDGQARAKVVAFTRERSWGADVSRFMGGLHVDRPVSAEASVNPPGLTIVAPEDMPTVSVGGMPLLLQDGRLQMELPDFGEVRTIGAELNATFDRYAVRAQAPGEDAAAPVMPPAELALERTVQIPVEPGSEANPIWRLHPVDLDGDGVEELIVLRANIAHAMSVAGETLWRFEAGGKMLSVAEGDLDGDGALELLLGSADEHIYVLDAVTGEEQRRHHCDVPLRVGRSSVRQPRVGALAVGDVDGDGTLDIIACLMNANLLRYDLDFNEVWRHTNIEHGPNEMELRDLDGDGKLKIIVGNHYGAVKIFDENGAMQSSVYSELGDVQMAVGDLSGDGVPEIANGSSTGAFTLRKWRTNEGFSFPNYGFAFTEVLMGALMGRERPELLLASETGYVYALDADGEVLARHNLGDAVNDITLIEGANPLLAAACDDGYVYTLDRSLQPTRWLHAGDRALRTGTIDGPEGLRLLVATRENVLVVAP